MNFPDRSHPIFSRPIVIGPGAIWKRPTKPSENPSDPNEPTPAEPADE